MNLIRIVLSIAATFAIHGCFPRIGPYDSVIDKGLVDYRAALNSQVKTMSEKSGKPEGTFDSSKVTYNDLGASADALLDRAQITSAGKGCKLPEKLNQRLSRSLGDKLPPALRVEAQSQDGGSAGCTEQLLKIIREQLTLLEQIHRDTDKCDAGDGSQISCLRPATAQTALAISNQSIDVAWSVEMAKK